MGDGRRDEPAQQDIGTLRSLSGQVRQRRERRLTNGGLVTFRVIHHARKDRVLIEQAERDEGHP